MAMAQAKSPRDRMIDKVYFVRLLICRAQMIGIGSKAKVTSVAMLMELLKSAMDKKMLLL